MTWRTIPGTRTVSWPATLRDVLREHPGINVAKACDLAGMPRLGCDENGYGRHTIERERMAGIYDMMEAGQLVVSAQGGLYLKGDLGVK